MVYPGLLLLALPVALGQQCFIEPDPSGHVVIPRSVTSIGVNAFNGCRSLSSVSIPDSVTSIGDNAFRGCSNLLSVSIPDSITGIGDNAFRECSNLLSVSIPDSITGIGPGTFFVCIRLSLVSIPDSVTSIGANAFHGCHNLSSVSIPDSVTRIAAAAFLACTKLASVSISDSVTRIDTNAFPSCLGFGLELDHGNSPRGEGLPCIVCENLPSVIIPDTITTIGEYAFYRCTSLVSVIVPSSVTSIANNAFLSCGSLVSVTIPDSVLRVEENALPSCLGFGLELDHGHSPRGEGLPCIACESVLSVNIPDTITSIGAGSFMFCPIVSLSIPDSVTSIGVNAFQSCGNLVSVGIPDSVASIDRTSFQNCGCSESLYVAGATLCQCSPGTCGPSQMPSCAPSSPTAAATVEVAAMPVHTPTNIVPINPPTLSPTRRDLNSARSDSSDSIPTLIVAAVAGVLLMALLATAAIFCYRTQLAERMRVPVNTTPPQILDMVENPLCAGTVTAAAAPEFLQSTYVNSNFARGDTSVNNVGDDSEPRDTFTVVPTTIIAEYANAHPTALEPSTAAEIPITYSVYNATKPVLLAKGTDFTYSEAAEYSTVDYQNDERLAAHRAQQRSLQTTDADAYVDLSAAQRSVAESATLSDA